MSRLQAQFAIAAVPWQWARQRSSRWPVVLLLALALLAVLATAATISWERAGLAAEVVLALAVALAWMMVFANLRQQNHPTLAHLLPGQTGRLREVTLAYFWGAALALGLLISQVFSAPWLPCVLISALALGAAALALRWPLLWVFWWIPMPLGVSAWDRWPALRDGVAWAQQVWTAQPLTVTLAAGLAFSLGVAHLLQTGGAAHQRAYGVEQRRSHMMRHSGAGQTTVKDSGPLILGAGHAFQVIYRRWLAYLCAHPQATPRHALARVEMAYIIGNHWTVMGMVSGLILAGGGLLALAAQQVFGVELGPALHRGAGTGLLFGLMSSSMSMLLSFRQSMCRGRREQALLRLLPAVPQGATLNRWVCGRLLAQLLLAWALTVGGVGLFTWWFDAPRWIFGPALLALPFGLGLLRDWSTLKPPGAGETTWLVLAMVLVCTAGGMAVAWGGLSLGLMAALELPLLLVVGVWRWRRLAGFAPALPVGRAG